MHVGTKVGEFSIKQRKKISSNVEIEQILEGDIITEYKVDSINNNFKKFSEKYGIKTDAKPESSSKKSSGKSQADELVSKLSAQFTQAVESTGFDPEIVQIPLKRQEVYTSNSLLDAEVRFALTNLKEMKDYLGNDSSIISQITEADLRKSRVLRTSVCEYKEFFFYIGNKPAKAFERTDISPEEKKVLVQQSSKQNSLMKDLGRYEEVYNHNLDMMRERAQGEEGVDYVQSIGDIDDPILPNTKILEKQIRREIAQLKLTDPEAAQEFEDQVLKPNELDSWFAQKIDLSEVKEYPGSEKGPHPADDVENYSRWFIENQPKSIYPDGEYGDF